ncbi:MAG: hypothetical protein HZA02_04285 [Nitrospinae bacterium]|nr:hypothetical protein [Nitrospinota bacterium]
MNILLDCDLNLLYMNPRAEKSLRAIAAEIRSAFHVELEDLIGGSILRIHPRPRELEIVWTAFVSFSQFRYRIRG